MIANNNLVNMLTWCLLVSSCLVCTCLGQQQQQHAGLDNNYVRDPIDYEYNHNGNRDRLTGIETSDSQLNGYNANNGNGVGNGGGWWETARNALSGPAGQIIVSMAKEMISRSTGNSQVRAFRSEELLIEVILFLVNV